MNTRIRPLETEAGGERLAWREAGDPDAAACLVLVHGWSASQDVWLEVLEDLGREARALTVDLPGHGRSARPAGPLGIDSMADALAAGGRELGLERATWVGHSMGSLVVARAAQRHPDLARRLVLVHPPHGPRLRASAERWTGTALGRAGLGALRRGLGTVGRAAPARAETRLAAFLRRSRIVGETDPEVVLAGLRAIGREGHRVLGPEPLPPSLVMGGRADPVVGLQGALALAEAHEAAELQLSRCGHHPFAQDRADFVARVLDYARRGEG